MGFITLFKVLKALGLFLREMWLRDRTFRQFVRENLPLIITSFGFVVMTMLFVHVVIIVKDQEIVIAEAQRAQTEMKKELDEKIPYLTERMQWYQERYFELKSDSSSIAIKSESPRSTVRTPRTPRPKQPVEQQVATRPPSTDLVERWKRLSQ